MPPWLEAWDTALGTVVLELTSLAGAEVVVVFEPGSPTTLGVCAGGVEAPDIDVVVGTVSGEVCVDSESSSFCQYSVDI
jgi:hypothetical protein